MNNREKAIQAYEEQVENRNLRVKKELLKTIDSILGECEHYFITKFGHIFLCLNDIPELLFYESLSGELKAVFSSSESLGYETDRFQIYGWADIGRAIENLEEKENV